jgi:predicted ATPase
MQTVADRPEAPTAIRTDLGAIFVSLELSRSTWLITSLSPGGGEKMSKQVVRGGGAGLVFRRGEPPDVNFLFKHALVQDAAYGTLLRGQRRELHARIAYVLEERLTTTAGAQPEILAHHFGNAGLIEKAVSYWQEAGERSKARSAMAEAIRQMRKALDLLSQLPDTPKRQRTELELQLALGGALIAATGHATDETAR